MISKLRKKYPKFTYQDYTWHTKKDYFQASFNFKIGPDIFFNPKIKIKGINAFKTEKEVLDNLVFNLGLIEMLSYWKSTCSPIIEIEAGKLNKEQIKWWKELIINGMGEFFYENKINWKKSSFLKIETNQDKKPFKPFSGKLKNKTLIPIGGGKDSIVTLEILKNKKDVSCFALNPNKTIKKIIKVGKCKSFITAERRIDPKLLELNRKGFLNGHTPFSAYLAFLNVLIATISNKKYIALSNERSSDEGNLNYLGREINHQYSKSFDFEKKFRKYSKKYLVKDVEYFSFLRPLYEIQIGKLFSKYFNKYGNTFLSCNEAYKTKSCTIKKTGKWCNQCPKCLFVFTILYPFIETKKLIKVFSGNLFENKKLVGLMKELIGEINFKPLECVGTKNENLSAFYLSLRKATKEKEKLPYLLKYFEDKILSKYPNLEKETKHILEVWNKNNNLQNQFLKLLKEKKRNS